MCGVCKPAALCAALFFFCAASSSCTLTSAVPPAVIAGDAGIRRADAQTVAPSDALPGETFSEEPAPTVPVVPSEEPVSEPAASAGVTPEPTDAFAVSQPPDDTESEPADMSPEAESEPQNGTAPASVDPVSPDAEVADPYPVSFAAAADPAHPSNARHEWYYIRNADRQPPSAQRDFDIRAYDAYYLGDISRKVAYLTFDEGYENGFTEQILDTLRDKNVPSAFFLTQPYIRDNPELCVRIAEEGHVAANHSVRHKDFPDLTDEEIAEELRDTADFYQETTGYAMSPIVRPPAGVYSERTLAVTQALGYRTAFWSFAHADWEQDNQPGAETAYRRVMDGLHNGAVILLHAVSESNTQALSDIIDGIRALGYTFESILALP